MRLEVEPKQMRESRCECRAAIFYHRNVVVCEWHKNLEAENERLRLQHAESQNEIHALRVAEEARADERDVEREENERLKEDLSGVEASNLALENKVKSLAPHGTCGDVCAHHSPTVERLKQELANSKNSHSTAITNRLHAKIAILEAKLKVAAVELEHAPHHEFCSLFDVELGDCDCWKAKALAAIKDVK